MLLRRLRNRHRRSLSLMGCATLSKQHNLRVPFRKFLLYCTGQKQMKTKMFLASVRLSSYTGVRIFDRPKTSLNHCGIYHQKSTCVLKLRKVSLGMFVSRASVKMLCFMSCCDPKNNLWRSVRFINTSRIKASNWQNISSRLPPYVSWQSNHLTRRHIWST